MKSTSSVEEHPASDQKRQEHPRTDPTEVCVISELQTASTSVHAWSHTKDPRPPEQRCDWLGKWHGREDEDETSGFLFLFSLFLTPRNWMKQKKGRRWISGSETTVFEGSTPPYNRSDSFQIHVQKKKKWGVTCSNWIWICSGKNVGKQKITLLQIWWLIIIIK